MKRIFIILCLMMICNISYADIASVGYVDSVVAGKQDSIADIATIRSGAGLGATAVQPSSLSTVATSGAYADLSGKPTLATVATSGSYNDLSNKPTIPSLPTGPSDGIYKMVWNGKFKTFMFQKESDLLSCPSGTYDIGFDQCIDPATSGSGYGYMNDSTGSYGADSSNAATYGLTTDQTWATEFSYGIIKGIALCNSINGISGRSTNATFRQPDEGRYCWCKMTFPAVSRWVFDDDYDSAANCAYKCAYRCGRGVLYYSNYRSGVFSSVGN